MLSTPKWIGLLAVAFVAGSVVSSPELRAYAANTIFSPDIADGEVKTADLANNAVTSAKIQNSEIKTNDLANGAVTASKLASGAISASTHTEFIVAHDVPAGQTQESAPFCNTGEAVVGGGYEHAGKFNILATKPFEDKGWYVKATNVGSKAADFTVYVNCLKVGP